VVKKIAPEATVCFQVAKHQSTQTGEDKQCSYPQDHKLGKVKYHILDHLEHGSELLRDPQFHKELDPSAGGCNGQEVLETDGRALHEPYDIDCIKLVITPIISCPWIITLIDYALHLSPGHEPDQHNDEEGAIYKKVNIDSTLFPLCLAGEVPL
jgi:hypothetical protein